MVRVGRCFVPCSAAARSQAARLVALTGWGREDGQRRSRGAGFDLHLTKPVSLEALDEALRVCAQRMAGGDIAV